MVEFNSSSSCTIIDGVFSRVLLSIGWLFVLVALVAVLRFPGKTVDIYLHDVYIPLNKLTLVVLLLLVFGAPLAALTVIIFRSKRT